MKRQAPAVKVGAAVQRTEKSFAGRPGAGMPSPQSLSMPVSQRVSAGSPASVGLSKYSAAYWPAGQPDPGVVSSQLARASAP